MVHFTAGLYKKLAGSDSRIKRIASLLLLGGILFLSILGILQIVNPQALADWIQLKLVLHGMGITGVLLYLLAVAILPLFSPLALLIVTGSAAFGPVTCFFLSYLGCLFNANITYWLLRFFCVEKLLGSGARSRWVKNGFDRYGFFIVIGLQLLCVIPFTLINALAVGGQMEWKSFIKATSIGIIPGIILYSFMGDTIARDFVSPRVYFSGVFVVAFLLIVVALRKKSGSKAVSRVGSDS